MHSQYFEVLNRIFKKALAYPEYVYFCKKRPDPISYNFLSFMCFIPCDFDRYAYFLYTLHFLPAFK